MRALFAKGVENMHIPWAVEGLPTLLHLSLFLFFSGLVIFLFNINKEVFTCVVWWIGVFSIVYVCITILPLFRLDSPYYTPLSVLARFPYAGIPYVTFKVLASIASHHDRYFKTWTRLRYRQLRNHYRGFLLGGVEEIAEGTTLRQSLDIDGGILGWTISALGDDHSLEKFIEAIPGFFNSDLVDLQERLPDVISRRLSDALEGFLGRTFGSNSVVDKVKHYRLDITFSAMDFIHDSHVSSILRTILIYWDQVPQTVEMGHTMARWCTGNDDYFAQAIVAKVLALRERDDRWVKLAARVYGLSEGDVREIVTHGDDSVSLAILNHLTRSSRMYPVWGDEFTKFDIRNTLSGLQHDFCTLWNVLVQEAKKQRPSSSVVILDRISDLYIALHDAAPTTFSSTDAIYSVLSLPSSYSLCDIASHRPDSSWIRYCRHFLLTQPVHSPDASPRHSTSAGNTVSPQVNEATAIAGPSSPSHLMTPSKVGDSSHATATASLTLPVLTSPPTDASPPAAVAAPMQDIPPAATLSHPLEGTAQRDVVVLNRPLESYDASAASPSNPLLPAFPVVGSASLPPSRVPSLNAESESLALVSNKTHFRPTGNVSLPHFRARGLVNTGSMCFANAVLQLLVHSPPFWNLIKDLGNLNRQSGAGDLAETGGGGTPLVDAMVRFCEEFMFKEKVPPPMQQPPQQAAMGTLGKNEDENKDSFEPTYMYDAIKEKMRLKILMACFRAS
jgi:hypothetical protein